MTQELKQVFALEDGTTFDTKAEALNYLRRPKIMDALMKVTDGNKDLSEWLVDNQETVVNAFDTGTIRRVTKSEKKKLDKAVDAIVESGNKAFDFVIEHAEAVKSSFRWPKVARMNDEEKTLMATTTLTEASDGNEQLAAWTIEHEAEILEAYDAGKEKRVVSPKAANALAAYRAGRAEEKRLIKDENMDPAKARIAGQELTAKLKAQAA